MNKEIDLLTLLSNLESLLKQLIPLVYEHRQGRETADLILRKQVQDHLLKTTTILQVLALITCAQETRGVQ